ncbi:MAG: LacI family DNA-binding transcriptional regulator [Bacteroidota bacterium]
MSITIRDVARRAGVSISTVSRVLNGSSPVREDKRDRVIEASEALGYAPNPAALSLLGKRTGGVGALLPFVSGEFFSELLGGLDQAAQSLERFLVVSTSHRKPDEFARIVRALDKRVDGLVVMAPELDSAAAASLLRASAPTVFLNTFAEGIEADMFNFDNAGGTRALTGHLIRHGHRRIAFAAGPPLAGDSQERARGYREAMDSAGLQPRQADAGYTRQAGADAARALIRSTTPPTAIVAANDECALGAILALREDGLSVPHDVSVVGFDDIPAAAHTTPSLTTVRVPIRDLGEQAVRQLAARIEGEDIGPPRHVVMPVEVVIRESTAPLP